MSEIADKSINRMRVGAYSPDNTPFCLLQLRAHASKDPSTNEKIEDLLNGVASEDYDDWNAPATLDCSISGCEVSVVEASAETPSRVTGQCKLTDYCLGESFKANKPDDDVTGKLGMMFSEHSAGSDCPQLECGLSAGFSIDGVSGTAGVCNKTQIQGQDTLDI